MEGFLVHSPKGFFPTRPPTASSTMFQSDLDYECTITVIRSAVLRWSFYCYLVASVTGSFVLTRLFKFTATFGYDNPDPR